SGRIPVISSIAPEIAPDGTPTGEVLNINADLAAAAIAEGLDAEKLVMLTDVEGLYRNWPDRGSLIPEISATELRAMLPELTSGMIPKAERSEEHTSELQSRFDLVCRLLLDKKKT